MNRFKVLAGATLAVALVMGGGMAAYADEEEVVDETTVVAVEEATPGEDVAPIEEAAPVEEAALAVDHGEPPYPVIEIARSQPIVDCLAGQQTVDVTTTTTPYVWSDEQNGWIRGIPQVEITHEVTPVDSSVCDATPPEETTLAMPILNDECGTENDWASVPENTLGVSYSWASEDVTNYDVYAIVNEGYVVNTIPEGWTATDSAGEFVYYWSPESTDIPCDATPPEETTLAMPILNDECGTENDWASVPENTLGVSYSWASEDVTNYDVYAIVNEGYVVNTIPEGWTATDLAGEFSYYWSPVWTDVPCEVAPPIDPPTEQPEPQPGPEPAAVVAPATTLAATGSDNNLLVPIGGGIAVILGIGLTLFGVIRRVRA